MKVKRSDRPTIEQAKLDDIEVLRGESANTSVATSHDSSVVSVPQDMEEEVTVTKWERPAKRRKLEAKLNCVTGKRQLIFDNQEDRTGGTGGANAITDSSYQPSVEETEARVRA